MAVQSIPLMNQIRLLLVVGQDAQGNNITRYRTINNVKPDATDQDVYDVGVLLAGLQKHPLVKVLRENDEELISL
ncbi:MAG: hypothetical protein CBR30_01690 [Dictyoglomus sp. NZ13-RE01]|nr:MAG: hypothetical protein CBR30_01690 [Dictyoglomus sp. NZ13-RE01]